MAFDLTCFTTRQAKIMASVSSGVGWRSVTHFHRWVVPAEYRGLDKQPSTHGLPLEPGVIAGGRRHIEEAKIFLAGQALERGRLKTRGHDGFHKKL